MDTTFGWQGPFTKRKIASQSATHRRLYVIIYLYYLFQLCTSSEVSNKTLYPTFARTVFDPGNTAVEVLEILKKFNWVHVAVITEDIPVWTKRRDSLVKSLQENNITITYKGSVPARVSYKYSRHSILFKERLKDVQGKARSRYTLYCSLSLRRLVVPPIILSRAALMLSNKYTSL